MQTKTLIATIIGLLVIGVGIIMLTKDKKRNNSLLEQTRLLTRADNPPSEGGLGFDENQESIFRKPQAVDDSLTSLVEPSDSLGISNKLVSLNSNYGTSYNPSTGTTTFPDGTTYGGVTETNPNNPSGGAGDSGEEGGSPDTETEGISGSGDEEDNQGGDDEVNGTENESTGGTSQEGNTGGTEIDVEALLLAEFNSIVNEFLDAYDETVWTALDTITLTFYTRVQEIRAEYTELAELVPIENENSESIQIIMAYQDEVDLELAELYEETQALLDALQPIHMNLYNQYYPQLNQSKFNILNLDPADYLIPVELEDYLVETYIAKISPIDLLLGVLT